MKKRTIRLQVEEGLKKEIENLHNKGCEFLRFKDLEFETDTEIIKCRSPFWGYGSLCYEEKIAWEYLRRNYNYERFSVVGFNGNSKFFKIK
jgi:hypothetical protein